MGNPVDCNGLLRMYNYIRLNMGKPAYRKILPSWMYRTPELFSHAFDELAAFELQQSTPCCLIHGDSHQGNTFLRNDESESGSTGNWLGRDVHGVTWRIS